MILSIFVLCLLVMQASLAPVANEDCLDYDSLYYNILNGQYETAARQTSSLYLDNKSNIIKLVVRRLLAESNRNLVDYAYKVSIGGLGNIMTCCFPQQFSLLFIGDQHLSFINLRDNMALKVAWNTDRDGDRGVYGDNNEWEQARMSWTLKRRWFRNRVYFKLENVGYHQYLKLEHSSDNVGEHKAFASNDNNTYRHSWYFVPAILNKQLVFFIINRQYDQALKLGRDVDGDNDRRAWGHSGYVINNPSHYAWYIRVHDKS